MTQGLGFRTLQDKGTAEDPEPSTLGPNCQGSLGLRVYLNPLRHGVRGGISTFLETPRTSHRIDTDQNKKYILNARAYILNQNVTHQSSIIGARDPTCSSF